MNLRSLDLKTNLSWLKVMSSLAVSSRVVMLVSQGLQLFYQQAHYLQCCGIPLSICQVSLGKQLLLLVQMVVISTWSCSMGCCMLTLGSFLCPVWHTNMQTWHLIGWRVWSFTALVEYHQLSCCTIGYASCICWDPLDPGITSGNHLRMRLSWCWWWPFYLYYCANTDTCWLFLTFNFYNMACVN